MRTRKITKNKKTKIRGKTKNLDMLEVGVNVLNTHGVVNNKYRCPFLNIEKVISVVINISVACSRD